MRARLLPPLVATALLAGALAAPAWAQRGIEAETFRPSIDGFGLLSTERAQTSRQWDFGFKLSADYAHRPLSLALSAPGEAPGGRKAVMDWQLVLHLGMHMGLTDWLELAFEVPLTAQSFSAAYGSPYDDLARAPTGLYAGSARTNVPPPTAGLLDPRVALKIRSRRAGPFGVALLAAATLPFGDDTAFLGDTGFTFRPTGVIDLTWPRFTLALNAGAILRTASTTISDPQAPRGQAAPLLLALGNELTAGLGFEVKLASFVSVSAEAYALLPLGRLPVDAALPDATDRVLGALAAVRFFPGSDLSVSLGGGLGLPLPGGGARRDAFRTVAVLSWTPSDAGGSRPGGGGGGGSGDRDGDGIADGADLCPEAAEDKDNFEDADGCPEPDNDGDGVSDGADRCPDEVEDRDGYQDADGCIDVDNDGDGVPDGARGPLAPGALLDACPDEPEDKDGFDDEDGCPEADNDGDRIADDKDRCPDEPETENGLDDGDGCPDSAAAFEAAARHGTGTVQLSESLVFLRGPRGRFVAPPSLKAIAERLVPLLKQPGRKLQVTAWQEPGDGSPEAASECATAVREEFEERGIERARIEVAVAAAGGTADKGSRKKAKKDKGHRVELNVTGGAP